MKFCDDCKWCSVNFKPSKDEASKYIYKKPDNADPRFYHCMHPLSSKGARFDCSYCTSMRAFHSHCGMGATLFEEKETDK